MSRLISELRVGSDDIVRITLEGSLRPRVCFRQWFRPAMGGEMRPGKAGLSVPAHKLDDLIAALQTARGAS